MALRDAYFDSARLWRAMDAQRRDRDMAWRQVVFDMDTGLTDGEVASGISHPLALSTVARLEHGESVGCQHALGYLLWLGASPESFMTPAGEGELLTAAPPGRRLRWNLPATNQAIRELKAERGMTWAQVADELGCAPNQVSGLSHRTYAISMTLAMRIAAWTGRSAASFTMHATW